MAERSRRLNNYLWSRKRAAEAPRLREKAIELEERWTEKERQSGELQLEEITLLSSPHILRSPAADVSYT